MEERYYNFLKNEAKDKMKSMTDSELLTEVSSHPFKIKEITELRKSDPHVRELKLQMGKVKQDLKVAEESYNTDTKKQKEVFDYACYLLESRGVKFQKRDIFKEVELEKAEKEKEENIAAGAKS